MFCWLVVNLLFNRTSRHSPQTSIQLVGLQCELMNEVILSQVQDLNFHFLELYEFPLYLFLMPVKVPWMTESPSSQSVTPLNFGCKLLKTTIYSIILIINEDIKQFWLLQYTDSNWLSSELHAANHNPLSPGLHPDFVSLSTYLACISSVCQWEYYSR